MRQEWGHGVKPPSMNHEAPWIYARAPVRKPSSQRETEMSRVIPEMRVEDDEIVVVHCRPSQPPETQRLPLSEESIDKIAGDHRITVGKWLIFRPPELIDELWDEIAKLTVAGELGVSAKVSTARTAGKSHVICVYTADYFDFEDVTGTRQRLRELGVNEQLYYKPDMYTYLGIYSGMPSIRPWRYRD